MRISELDDIEKEALLGAVVDRARADLNDGRPLTEMRPWFSFTIQITLKINRGSLGIKHERYGEFRLCAQSRHDAIALACSNVPAHGERLVQVTESVRVK